MSCTELRLLPALQNNTQLEHNRELETNYFIQIYLQMLLLLVTETLDNIIHDHQYPLKIYTSE